MSIVIKIPHLTLKMKLNKPLLEPDGFSLMKKKMLLFNSPFTDLDKCIDVYMHLLIWEIYIMDCLVLNLEIRTDALEKWDPSFNTLAGDVLWFYTEWEYKIIKSKYVDLKNKYYSLNSAHFDYVIRNPQGILRLE